MIDLHTHSTASDGADSPAALLRLAESCGLSALAITDHDTLAGVAEAAAIASPVTLITGLELSTRILDETDPASRSAHLLGYFLNPPPASFVAWLESLKTNRRKRNLEMARLLQLQGLDITLEEAESLGRNITGRPHFALLMRAKGYVQSWEEAFHLYLGEHGSAYVEREDPPIREGIGRIKSAGGITSLAHPLRLSKPDPQSEQRLIARLVESGLDGLEAFHPDHSTSDAARYLALAARYSLITTGGSDHHGDNKPGASLGIWNRQPIPANLLDGLRLRAVNS
jgi:3',5'-nucleoside bisphosphate phosphatase